MAKLAGKLPDGDRNGLAAIATELEEEMRAAFGTDDNGEMAAG